MYLAGDVSRRGLGAVPRHSGVEPVPMWSETVISGASLGAGEAVLIGGAHEMAGVVALPGLDGRQARLGQEARATPVEPLLRADPRRATPSSRARVTRTSPSSSRRPARCRSTRSRRRRSPTTRCSSRTASRRSTPACSCSTSTRSRPRAVVGRPCHTSTTRNGWIAREPDGITVSHVLVNAWRSTLGDSDADTRLDEVDNCPRSPTPASSTATRTASATRATRRRRSRAASAARCRRRSR